MRIWDISPRKLCRNHLLGEHREIHAVFSILSNHKKGYANHPETLRWKGKLRALWLRHETLAEEMRRRGYIHNSPIDRRKAAGRSVQDEFVDSIAKQKKILAAKGCSCTVH